MVDTAKLKSIIRDVDDATDDTADALEQFDEMAGFLQTSETARKACHYVEKAHDHLEEALRLLEKFQFGPDGT